MKKITLFVLVASLALNTEAQMITKIKTMKHFVKTSALMRDNLEQGKTAKWVKQVRSGNDWSITEYYTMIVDYKVANPFFCCVDSANMRIVKVEKNRLLDVNKMTNELTEFKKSKDSYYDQYRNHQEVNHYCLFFYQCSLAKLTPMGNGGAFLNKVVDTVIRNVPCLVYSGKSQSYYYKNSILEKPEGTLTIGYTYYINKNSCQLDSISIIETRSDGKWSSMKEYLCDIPDFDYKNLEAMLDFDNGIYALFSRHDNQSLPYSMTGTKNEEITQEMLRFPLKNLKGEQTTLNKEEGWLLVDLWQFGCGSCYEKFKCFGKEKTSEGQTTLEKAGVKLLCINPLSDNMEQIRKIAEKYNVNDILYAGKGLNTLIKAQYYPTFYLVSPKKEVVLKGNSINDDEIIETIEKYK